DNGERQNRGQSDDPTVLEGIHSEAEYTKMDHHRGTETLRKRAVNELLMRVFSVSLCLCGDPDISDILHVISRGGSPQWPLSSLLTGSDKASMSRRRCRCCGYCAIRLASPEPSLVAACSFAAPVLFTSTALLPARAVPRSQRLPARTS